MIQSVSGVSAEKAVQIIDRWPTPFSFYDEAEQHKIEVEKENAKLLSLLTTKPKKKRNPEDFVAEKLGPSTSLRAVKGKLGAKIYQVFHCDAPYPDE